MVGYPSYSEYKEGATDLFKASILLGGDKYQRKYRFSNGAHFSSFHNISFDKATGLRGTFTTRDFPVEAFPGTWAVQDLAETFIPSGPGLIKNIMAVEWKGDTRNLSAVIESEYYLNHNKELPGLHWRHVTFNTNKSRTRECISRVRRLRSTAPFSAIIRRIFSKLSKVWRWNLRVVSSSKKRLRVPESQAPELRHIRRACDTPGDEEKIRSHNVMRSVSVHNEEGFKLEHSFRPVEKLHKEWWYRKYMMRALPSH